MSAKSVIVLPVGLIVLPVDTSNFLNDQKLTLCKTPNTSKWHNKIW